MGNIDYFICFPRQTQFPFGDIAHGIAYNNAYRDNSPI